MTVRALIYVQHLLGIGHLARASRIAAGLRSAGVAVTMVQGGTATGLPLPEDVDSVQLPPVKVAAADMSTLLHADGRTFTAEDEDSRCRMLIDLLRRLRPDILLTEAFPFGRRQMRFELAPLLLEARRSGVALIASSVRDLLQENRKPGRAEETIDLVNRWFDLVLVHGDVAMTPLNLTFPLADRIAPKLRYTGLVGPEPTATTGRRRGVVISAGGGIVGFKLLEAAIMAAPFTRLRRQPWLALAGSSLPQADLAQLESLAAKSAVAIKVLRSVPDLPARLANARLSISQAGYNTVADILTAGCASVLVPFAACGETEQTARAGLLAATRRAVVTAEADLTPDVLAAAADEALALPRAAPQVLGGGARTAAILLGELSGRTSARMRLEPQGGVVSSHAVGRS